MEGKHEKKRESTIHGDTHAASNESTSRVYQLPIAAVLSYYTLGDLKQNKMHYLTVLERRHLK